MLSHREPTGAKLRRAARRNNTEAHGEGRRLAGGAHALAGPVSLDSHCAKKRKKTPRTKQHFRVANKLILKTHLRIKWIFYSLSGLLSFFFWF